MSTSKPDLDAAAAKFVDQDRANARLRIIELEAEIDVRQAEKRALEYKLNKLGPDIGPSSGNAKITGFAPKVITAKPKGNGSSNASSLGLRGTILSVLKGSQRGMMPREIVDTMKSLGFQVSGSTSLKARVHNDLHKMLSADRIKRRVNGYVINEAGQTDLSL